LNDLALRAKYIYIVADHQTLIFVDEMRPLQYILILLITTHAGLSLSQGSGIETLQQALDAARESNNYSHLAWAYFDLAIYEEDTNKNLEKSFEHLSRGLEYFELVGNDTYTNVCKYHIARQLLQNGMHEDAKSKLDELKTFFESKEDYENLALVELQLFDYYFEKLDVDEARNTLKSLDLKLSALGKHDLTLEQLGKKIVLSELLKDYNLALKLANDCYNLSIKDGTPQENATCLLARGRLFSKQGEHEAAIGDLEKCLEVLSAFPYSKERLQAYELLSSSYEAQEEMQLAYLYSQKYASLQDSILNENRLLAINNLTYKYESKEKAAEIKLLERDKAYVQQNIQQQRRALIVLGMALGGLLLGIYYIVRFYSEKIKAAKIIEDQNEKINKQKIVELQDRIQINSMQSMITGQEVERERIAKDLHDSLGGLLSTIKLQVGNIDKSGGKSEQSSAINHATKLLDVAVSEIRTISQDLQPGALKRLGLVPAINDLVNRYQSDKGPEITFQHFDLPKEMDQAFAMGIYRIVQEILNNAIKHAQASEIFVQLNMEDDDLVIHIEDDGIGFDPNKKYKSMGLANIRSRVNYLRGSIDIDSRMNEGTSFVIYLSSKFNEAGIEQES